MAEGEPDVGRNERKREYSRDLSANIFHSYSIRFFFCDENAMLQTCDFLGFFVKTLPSFFSLERYFFLSWPESEQQKKNVP